MDRRFHPMPGIQRQCKFVEDRSGMKFIFGQRDGSKTDAQAQTENSQASNELFGSNNRIMTKK